MPQINEAVATETPVAAPAATPEPKAVKAAKPSANGKPKTKSAPAKQVTKTDAKPGLRKPQVRILAVLNKAGRALDRKTISAKASADLAMLNSYIGSIDEEKRKKNDKAVCMSLLSLGFVRFGNNEDEGGTVYEITARGKAALEKAK